MKQLRAFLFAKPTGPLWRYCLFAFLLASLPSAALGIAVQWSLVAAVPRGNRECAKMGLKLLKDTSMVCERFEVIFQPQTTNIVNRSIHDRLVDTRRIRGFGGRL